MKDLSGDGTITQKDVLMGRGVIAKKRGGSAKKGLYANIHAKKARIKAGSKEKMRKVGSKGAPTAKAFKQSAKTAKKRPRKRTKKG